MEIRNLQSLLVCSIILWRVSSTEDDWIFGWRSRLASLILILCSPFTLFHCGWMKRLLDRWTPLIQFLRMRCWWWRIWIYKNVSRKTMCVPNAWRPFSAARHPKERLCIPSRIGWGGNDTGRLGTWEFPLRIDSASWNSFESFMQFISCCKSCIRPESSKIVSWSSTNLRLARVSKVELWNFFNSVISLRLFWWASRNSKFCCNNCPCRSCWSRRWSSSAWMKFVSVNFCLALGKNSLFLSVQQSSNLCILTTWLSRSPRSFSNRSPRSFGHRRRLTDRQVFSLSDGHVLGELHAAYPRVRRHRTRRPRETLAWSKTAARSGALCRTRRRSPWSRRRWAHNLWGSRSRQWRPYPFWADCTGTLRASRWVSGRSATKGSRGKWWREWRDQWRGRTAHIVGACGWVGDGRCSDLSHAVQCAMWRYADTRWTRLGTLKCSCWRPLCGRQSWLSCRHWCRSCSRATSPRKHNIPILNSHFCAFSLIVRLLSDCIKWSSILYCSHLLHSLAPRKRVI